MLRIRRSWDRLIFNMGILILVRWHLHIVTNPCSSENMGMQIPCQIFLIFAHKTSYVPQFLFHNVLFHNSLDLNSPPITSSHFLPGTICIPALPPSSTLSPRADGTQIHQFAMNVNITRMSDRHDFSHNRGSLGLFQLEVKFYMMPLFHIFKHFVYSISYHRYIVLVDDLHLLQIKATVLLFFTVPTLNKVFLLLLLLLSVVLCMFGSLYIITKKF